MVTMLVLVVSMAKREGGGWVWPSVWHCVSAVRSLMSLLGQWSAGCGSSRWVGLPVWRFGVSQPVCSLRWHRLMPADAAVPLVADFKAGWQCSEKSWLVHYTGWKLFLESPWKSIHFPGCGKSLKTEKDLEIFGIWWKKRPPWWKRTLKVLEFQYFMIIITAMWQFCCQRKVFKFPPKIMATLAIVVFLSDVVGGSLRRRWWLWQGWEWRNRD